MAKNPPKPDPLSGRGVKPKLQGSEVGAAVEAMPRDTIEQAAMWRNAADAFNAGDLATAHKLATA